MMVMTMATATTLVLKDESTNDDGGNLNRQDIFKGAQPFLHAEVGRKPGKAVAYLAAALAFQIPAYISQMSWCNRHVQQHVQATAKAPGTTCHELTRQT